MTINDLFGKYCVNDEELEKARKLLERLKSEFTRKPTATRMPLIATLERHIAACESHNLLKDSFKIFFPMADLNRRPIGKEAEVLAKMNTSKKAFELAVVSAERVAAPQATAC